MSKRDFQANPLTPDEINWLCKAKPYISRTPWVVDEDDPSEVFSANNLGVHFDHDIRIGEDTAYNNARLIAAAPELFEALQETFNFLRNRLDEDMVAKVPVIQLVARALMRVIEVPS